MKLIDIKIDLFHCLNWSQPRFSFFTIKIWLLFFFSLKSKTKKQERESLNRNWCVENQRDQKNKWKSIRIKLNFFANFEVDTYFTYIFHRSPSSINLALVKQIKVNWPSIWPQKSLINEKESQWQSIVNYGTVT